MKRYSSVVVELSKEAAMLLVLWTVELFPAAWRAPSPAKISQRRVTPRLCKHTIVKKHDAIFETTEYSEMQNHIAQKTGKAVSVAFVLARNRDLQENCINVNNR